MPIDKLLWQQKFLVNSAQCKQKDQAAQERTLLE